MRSQVDHVALVQTSISLHPVSNNLAWHGWVRVHMSYGLLRLIKVKMT